MNILFLHQNFPGQFLHWAPALAAQGHRIVALGINGRSLPGVRYIAYNAKPLPQANSHPWLRDSQTKLLRGEACAHAMIRLRREGFRPELIIAHPGWGEAWFAKDVFPDARLLLFQEFFYAATGADAGFDPEFSQPSDQASMRTRVRNTHLLHGLASMDWGISPTFWQRQQLPQVYQPKTSVIFDGVDTRVLAPDTNGCLTLPNGQALTPDDEVISFVNRNLEPYRGYHRFMRALPAVLSARPKAQVVIVGGDSVSYGAAPPQGKTWKDIFFDEVKDGLDVSRVHFLGRVSYQEYLRLLQVATCHVYLTYPFVLSWSCIEALSVGVPVVGSKTAPVEEVIEHGHNGFLVDFFDATALAEQVIDVLHNRHHLHTLRNAARQTVIARYDLHGVCLPQRLALTEILARGNTPPAAKT